MALQPLLLVVLCFGVLQNSQSAPRGTARNPLPAGGMLQRLRNFDQVGGHGGPQMTQLPTGHGVGIAPAGHGHGHDYGQRGVGSEQYLIIPDSVETHSLENDSPEVYARYLV